MVIVLQLGAAFPISLKCQIPNHQTINPTTWSLIPVSFLVLEKGKRGLGRKVDLNEILETEAYWVSLINLKYSVYPDGTGPDV